MRRYFGVVLYHSHIKPETIAGMETPRCSSAVSTVLPSENVNASKVILKVADQTGFKYDNDDRPYDISICDVIKWSRDLYVEHVTGIRQYQSGH
uniref:Glutamine synthetase n=1 Tax=Panagrellus redivivus TaxID=6233 RepID=A0A7E4VBR3_PANRE